MTLLEPVDPRTLRIAVSIVHHPSRPELPGRLLSLLASSSRERFRHVRVVVDPDPAGGVSPWRTYRHALLTTPPDATHHLVLQDDALPCRYFLDAAYRAVAHRPGDVVAFFVNHLADQTARRIVQACQAGAAWAPRCDEPFVPTVATLYPTGLALDAANMRPDRPSVIADDEVIGDWARYRRVQVWCTAPNLVQHDEDAPSTITGHRDGRQRWAVCFIGDHSHRLVDWRRTL